MAQLRRCECPCRLPLPADAPERQRFKSDTHKMRHRRAEAAESRATSADLVARIVLGGAGLSARRARLKRRPNGGRPALTEAPERVSLTT